MSDSLSVRTMNTVLYCTRWQQTVAFYRQDIGLSSTFSNDWFCEFLINPHARLSVADASRTSIAPSGGDGVTVCFEVDDADRAHAGFLERGLSPQPVRNHSFGARVFYLHDPEGNRLEFWSPSTAGEHAA